MSVRTRSKNCSRLAGSVPGPRQRGAHREDAIGSKSRVHMLHVPQCTHQQPRRDQQHDRRGDFGDHKSRTQPLGRPAWTNRRGLAQRIQPGAAGHTERWKHAESNSSRDCHHRSQAEQPEVHGWHLRDGQACRNQPRDERRRGNRDEHAKRTATARHQHALGQQLSDEALGRGSDGDPHRQFAATPERARHEQMREVHARDEQQTERGARQRESISRACDPSSSRSRMTVALVFASPSGYWRSSCAAMSQLGPRLIRP